MPDPAETPPPEDELVIDPEQPDPLVADLPEPDPDDEPPPRRRGSSAAGGMLAASMLGLRNVLEGPPKDQIVVQVDAAGDPPNIDLDGVKGHLDSGHRLSGPPLDDLKARAEVARRVRVRRRRRLS